MGLHVSDDELFEHLGARRPTGDTIVGPALMVKSRGVRSSVASKYVSKRGSKDVLASAEASRCLSISNLARWFSRFLARANSIA